MHPTLIIAVLLIAALVIVAVLTARTHTPPFRYADSRLVEGAIAEERRVMLGGWQHYVLVRGRTAPVLVFVHGGLGTSEMPMLRVHNAAPEDHFVFANWD